jgi:hypothetical protein
MAIAPSFEAVARMVDFVEQLKGLDEGFPNPSCDHPTALLRGLVENHALKDAEMTGLIGSLLQMGAEVNQEMSNVLVQLHPNHTTSYHTLIVASHEIDIKEPAEI